MIRKTDRAFAEKWLVKAARDLVMADRALTLPDALTDMACFHAQQAIEKALKGILTLHGVTFEKTHSLKPLLDSAKKLLPKLSIKPVTLAGFSSYGVMVRYPGWMDDPSIEDSRKALDVATDIVKQASEHIEDSVHPKARRTSIKRKKRIA